jgi:TolB protein
MKHSLKMTSAVLGLLLLIVACKPSGNLTTNKSPLAPQSVSPLTSPAPPTPNPTDAALCAKYPTPPYPINLTPCPYYLTPPSQPIDLFTPQPLPTPVLPALIIGQPVATAKGGAFKSLYVSPIYSEGVIGDLRISPDGQKVAFTIYNSEGYTIVLIMDIEKGTGFRVGVSDVSGIRPFAKATWFRGWFPDSKQVLLMSDWLEIRNIETGESRQITPKGETVTDAAVSPDGQKIIYTVIQGDKLKVIDSAGNRLQELSAPLPKPGDRPENLTWSPNGKWIAYTWDQSSIYYAGPVWVIDIATGQMRQLSPAGAYDFSSRWSPDSATLLVVRRENTQDSKANSNPAQWISNLWTVDVDQTIWKQLTHLEGNSVWAPNWVPDGSAIAFMSDSTGRSSAWMINLNDMKSEPLTSERAEDNSAAPLNLGVVPEATP